MKKFEIEGLLIVELYDLMCGCKSISVKGKKACLDDFGEMTDMSPKTAPLYGCGDMGFVPNKATNDILKKYDIDVDEYNRICDYLTRKLHIGKCSVCS